jgi:hypothetical protein
MADSRPSTASSSDRKEASLNALRIQTDNLARMTPSSPQIRSNKSYNSLNESFTSSPIITPSGSSLNLPSSTLTPLPSPLILNNAFPSNLSLDQLVLSPSPRRKGYGTLGSGGGGPSEKRNATDFVSPNDPALGRDRSISSGQSVGDDKLRREDILGKRSRQSSVGDEAYVKFFENCVDSRIWNIGARRTINGYARRRDT